MDGNIEISMSNTYLFNDSISNDILIYTGSSNQHILIGTVSNDTSALNFYRSNVTINRITFLGCNVSVGNSSNYVTFQTDNDFLALVNDAPWLSNHGGKALYMRYSCNEDSSYIQSGSRDEFSRSNFKNIHIDASNIHLLTESSVYISSDGKVSIGSSNIEETLTLSGNLKTSGKLVMYSNNYISFTNDFLTSNSGTIGFNSNYLDIYGADDSTTGRKIYFWIDSNELAGNLGNAVFYGGKIIIDHGKLLVGSYSNDNEKLNLLGKTYIGTKLPSSNTDATIHLGNTSEPAISFEAYSNLSQIRLASNNLKFSLNDDAKFISGMSMLDGSGGFESLTITKSNISIPIDVYVNGVLNASNLQIFGESLSATTGGGFTASSNDISYTFCNVEIGSSNSNLTNMLEVLGGVKFYSNVNINDNISINNSVLSNLYVYTDIISSNTLSNINTAYFSSNVIVDSNMYVNQKLITSNINVQRIINSNTTSNIGNVFIGCNLVVGSNLNANYRVLFSNTFSNLGDTSIGCNLLLASNLTVNQQVLFSDTFSNLGNAYIGGSNLLVESNLYIKQQFIGSNTFSNVDNVSFSSNLFVRSNFTVNQDVLFSNTLSNLGNASFSCNVLIGSNLISTRVLNSNTFSNLGIASFSMPTTVNSNLYVNKIQVLPNLSNNYFVASNLRVNLQTKDITTARVSSWDIFRQTSNAQQPYWSSNTGISGRSEVIFYTGSNSMMWASNVQFNIASNGGFTFGMYYKFRSNLNWERIMEALPGSNTNYEQFVVARQGTTSTLSVAIAGNARMIQVAPIVQNTYAILLYRYTVSNANHSLWQNNTLLYSSNGAVSLGDGPWNIGLCANVYGSAANLTTGLVNNYGQFGNVSLQSLFMYDRALSDTELGNMYNYMNMNYVSIASILNYAGIFGGSIFFNTGYLGVGTTDPYCKLHISDSNSNVSIRMSASNTLTSDIGIVNNSNEFITGSKKGDLCILNTIGSNIVLGSTSNSNVLTVTQSNIGIFKSNPAYTLDITGSVNITSSLNVGGVVTVASNIMPLSNLVYDLGSSNMRFGTIYLASNTIDMETVQIKVDSSGGLKLTDSNNSNVPIIVNKVIVGSGSNLVHMSLDSNNSVTFANVTLSNGIEISSSNTTVGGWSNESSNIFILGSNIGIGLSNPTKTLDVQGDINFTGGIYQAGTQYVSGDGGSSILIDSNNLAIISSNSTWSLISTWRAHIPFKSLGVASSTGTNTVHCLDLDASSNIYISGIYGPGTVTLYDSNASTSTLSLPTTLSNALLASKISSSGTIVWSVGIDNIIQDSTSSISVDNTSNVIVIGSYNSSNLPIIYNSNLAVASNIPSLPTTSDLGTLLVKYASNAQASWASSILHVTGTSVNVESSNNIIVSGTSVSGIQPVAYNMSNAIVSVPYKLSAYAEVTTFAGSITSFNGPTGIVSFSNVFYITDTNNARIRKITLDGTDTIFAGSGTASFLDDTGTNAKFNGPQGITIDIAGTIYVADTNNNRIRKITPDGTVTTFAGSGTASYLDGTGTNARFDTPYNLAVDIAGNVYVSDTNNNRIRKITSAGVVTTFAGSGTATFLNGTGTNASFNSPRGIVIDASSNIYIADTFNHCIRKITSAGVVSTFAGSGNATFSDGTGSSAGFNTPYGINMDVFGNFYVADYNNNRIRKITSAGVVTTIAGFGTATYLDGTGTNAGFYNPAGVAADSFGNIYVSDKGNSYIRRIEMMGVQVDTFAGSGTATFINGTGWFAGFNGPNDIAIDPFENLYIADSGNNRIRKITPDGIVTTLAGSGAATYLDSTGTLAGINNPYGIIYEPNSGNLFVVDAGDNRIRKITLDGIVTTLAGSGTATYIDGTGTNAGFNYLSAIACDSTGNLYVTEMTNYRIRKITQSGVVTTIAGKGTSTFFDANGTLAGIVAPRGIVVHSDGTIYFTDAGANRIRKIATNGDVTTLAGSGAATFLNGIGTNAGFNYPFGIGIDKNGNLIVNEQGNDRVRKITLDGIVTTLAGSGTQTWLDGTGQTAGFTNCTGIKTNMQTGIIYIADYGNNRIRRIFSPWIITTLAGSGVQSYAEGTGTGAMFGYLNGMTVDPVSGTVYVSDAGNQRIRKITSAGVVTTLAGSGTGTFLDSTGTLAGFLYPQGLALDSFGNLFVADQGNNRIRKITPSGVVTTFAGNSTGTYLDGTGTNASFYNITDVAVDSSNNIYVTEYNGHRVRKITPDAVVTTLAGKGTATYIDGVGTNAGFNGLQGVAVDLNGNLYVTENAGHRVRKITPSGVVSTVAGSGVAGTNNGTGTNSQFSGPAGIEVTPDGTILYVADNNSHRIRKVLIQTGLVTTIAGSGTGTFADGVGLLASFKNPFGISIDNNGILYIAENTNFRVRKMIPSSTFSSATAIVASSTVSLPTPSNTSAIAVKYDSSGISQWAITIDGGSSDANNFVTTDSSNNVYLVGKYGSASATVYKNTTVQTSLSNLNASSSNAVFALKADSNGTPQWVVKIDGTGIDQGLTAGTDTNGNLYIAGSYQNSNTIIYSANGSAFVTLPDPANTSSFLTKFNSAGIPQWYSTIKQTDVNGSNAINSISIDGSNNIYAVGYYVGSNIISDGSNPIALTLPVRSSVSGFVIKYNSNGSPLQSFGLLGTADNSNVVLSSVTVDQSGSNLYVGGYYNSNITIYTSEMNSTINLPVCGSNTLKTGLITQYQLQYASNFNIPALTSNTSNDGTLKYILNTDQTTPVILNTLSSNQSIVSTSVLNPGSTAQYSWYGNQWYKFV